MWLVKQLLTCHIEVIIHIIGYDDICLVQDSVMTDPVFLKVLGVKYCDLHLPHTGHSIQHHFITPKVLPEHQSQVLLEWQRWVPALSGSSLSSTLYRDIKARNLFWIDQLAVVNHVVHYHPPKIPVEKEGGIPWTWQCRLTVTCWQCWTSNGLFHPPAKERNTV